jgi:shikimate kinase
VATGGGFLSLHADLLRDHTAVLVPITFETYRARLLGDATRPRLRPQLSLEEELAQVYAEREERHAAADTISLLDFLRASSVAPVGGGSPRASGPQWP